MNWERLPPLERDVAAPHDIAPCGEYSNVVGRVCQENILKPIKVRWPNLSCWGSHSIPWIQLARHALALSTPSQHIQPEPSIACLTWHIITVEIFVYFVRVPQSALQPTAKSSQLPLQLSQPESLIKTRCFHLGQLWKKSLPECGPLTAKPCCWRLYHVWQSWHSHRDQRGCPPPSSRPPALPPHSFFFFFSFQPKCATESGALHKSGLREHSAAPSMAPGVNMKKRLLLKLSRLLLKSPRSMTSSNFSHRTL